MYGCNSFTNILIFREIEGSYYKYLNKSKIILQTMIKSLRLKRWVEHVSAKWRHYRWTLLLIIMLHVLGHALHPYKQTHT